MSNKRVYNAADVLSLLENGNESDLSDVSESGTDDDDEYSPLASDGVPVDDTTSDSDSEDNEPLTNLQPEKQQQSRTKFTWKKAHFEPPEIEFVGAVADPPADVSSPLEYFKKFITDDMIKQLTDTTNVYAIQKTGKELDTTVKELEQVIGMYLKMGLVRMPGNRMYWELDTRYPPIADIMSRNRFQSILACLHFVNNLDVSEDDKRDKLWKIRPWLTEFRGNCLNLVPEEYNSIDEQMVPFKGKFSSVKQYMRNKPHKWGFKIWCRCGISGLLYDFDVYQGSGGAKRVAEQSLGVSGDVVTKLCSTLPQGKNYKVIADNFFTSMNLIVTLKERGILYLGTVRNNRIQNCQLTDEKQLKRQGRGSFDYCVEATHQVSLVRWFDNRAVTLASSYVGPEPSDTVRRWDKQKKDFVEVARPNAVKVYNSFMGGVDFLDSLISKYRYPMKSRRWYIYLFWHTVNTALVQAWLLYRKHCQVLEIPKKQQLTHRKFQANVATAITLINLPVRKRGRPSGDHMTVYSPKQVRVGQPDDVRFDNVGHLPLKLEKRGRCKVCRDGYTDTSCEKCDVRLCFNEKRNCYYIYHNKST